MKRRGMWIGWRVGVLALAVVTAGPRTAVDRAGADEPKKAAPEPSTARQAADNLDRIGYAIHKFNMEYLAYPGSAICDAAGKPLLSWRVAILPFLDEKALYDEFKRDESWDSPHNKKLLARMPKVFAVPGDSSAASHETPFRAFVGERAAFPPPRPPKGAVSAGRRLMDIVDGTNNTLAVGEAAETVPWTKPDELAFGPDKPLPKLGGRFRGGFLAMCLDGRVVFLGQQTDEKALRSVIDPFDGVTFDPRKLEVPQP